MIHHATITVNPRRIIGEARDHLYGANLEHIGQAIYGGVWAEMLRDRKFAGNDLMYAGMSEGLHNAHEGAGVVVPWQAHNPAADALRYAHDNSVFYTGRQSQRVSIRRADGEWRGICQGGLYLHAARDYQLRLVLRGEGRARRLGDCRAHLHRGRRRPAGPAAHRDHNWHGLDWLRFVDAHRPCSWIPP